MLPRSENMRAGERRKKKRERERARLIFSLQLKLLQKATAPWHRRSARLLAINCGDGALLPFLWRGGFEVTATEADPALREAARAREPDIDVRAARDDDLPFEDDFFEWAIMHVLPGADGRLKAGMEECLRVARKGLIFSFWNSSSLPCLCWRLSGAGPWPPAAVPLLKICRLARGLGAGAMSVLTTLWLPYSAWRQKPALAALNAAPPFLPIGAWALARLDLGNPKPVTPLRLRLENVFSRAVPAMEFSEKNTVQKQN